MAPLDLNVSTVVVLAVLAGLAFLSARRMFRNGTCDCHKDNPRSKSDANASQPAGCSGCSCASCGYCPSAALQEHIVASSDPRIVKAPTQSVSTTPQ